VGRLSKVRAGRWVSRAERKDDSRVVKLGVVVEGEEGLWEWTEMWAWAALPPEAGQGEISL
jgi:hypothetical protein